MTIEDGTLVTGAADTGSGTEGDPPAGDPPAGDPPAGDPPAGDPPAGDPPAGDPPEGDPPTGAPEAYEEFTLPEGMEINAEVMKTFKELAKGADMTQEVAQGVIDLQVQLAEGQRDALVAQRKVWVEEIKTDKDLGGDNLEANTGLVRNALQHFGSAELKTLLDQTGFGDHPAVFRHFLAVGKAMGESDVLTGKETHAGETDTASRMFGDMFNEDGSPKTKAEMAKKK